MEIIFKSINSKMAFKIENFSNIIGDGSYFYIIKFRYNEVIAELIKLVEFIRFDCNEFVIKEFNKEILKESNKINPGSIITKIKEIKEEKVVEISFSLDDI